MAIATAAPSVAIGGRGLVRLGSVRGETKQSREQRPSASFCGSNAGAGGRISLRWGASSCIGDGTTLWLPSRPLRMRSFEHILRVVAAGDIERSYIMIKPDGVQRGIVGEIISRFERKGFTLKGLKLFQTPQELAEVHYSELKEKPFFPKLVKYIVSGPVVAMVWEGPGVVASARKLIGVTNPLNAEPGTIRGDFGVNTGRNVIHGSDSPENGKREIELWFKEGEVVDWEPSLTPWILE